MGYWFLDAFTLSCLSVFLDCGWHFFDIGSVCTLFPVASLDRHNRSKGLLHMLAALLMQHKYPLRACLRISADRYKSLILP